MSVGDETTTSSQPSSAPHPHKMYETSQRDVESFTNLRKDKTNAGRTYIFVDASHIEVGGEIDSVTYDGSIEQGAIYADQITRYLLPPNGFYLSVVKSPPQESMDEPSNIAVTEATAPLLEAIYKLQLQMKELNEKYEIMEKNAEKEIAQLKTRIESLEPSTHEAVAFVRMRALIESYCGLRGWKGKDRSAFISAMKDPSGLFTSSTLTKLQAKYVKETETNTTHRVRISDALTTITRGFSTGSITASEFMSLFAMLNAINDESSPLTPNKLSNRLCNSETRQDVILKLLSCTKTVTAPRIATRGLRGERGGKIKESRKPQSVVGDGETALISEKWMVLMSRSWWKRLSVW